MRPNIRERPQLADNKQSSLQQSHNVEGINGLITAVNANSPHIIEPLNSHRDVRRVEKLHSTQQLGHNNLIATQTNIDDLSKKKRRQKSKKRRN